MGGRRIAIGSSQTAYTSLISPAFSPDRFVSSTVKAVQSSRRPHSHRSRGDSCPGAAARATAMARPYPAVVTMMKATSHRGSCHNGHSRAARARFCTRLQRSELISSSLASRLASFAYLTLGQGNNDAPYCHRASVPAVKPPLPADTKIHDCSQKPHDKVTQCSQASLAPTLVAGE